MPKPARPRPNRVTFDAEQDVIELLPPQTPRGPRRDYLQAAVRHFARPPVCLRVARSDDEARDQLASFVEAATSDILLVGASLDFTVVTCRDALDRKVSKNVAVTSILMRCDFGKNSAFAKMLAQRLGGSEFAAGMLAQARESTRYLLGLRALGRQHGTRVQVRICSEMPTFGLVVRDRMTDHKMMRVVLYSHASMNHRHPFLEIDPAAEGGEDAYSVFDNYFEDLLSRSPELPDER